MFNKLVRDKIIEHQLAIGAKPKYKLLNKDQHILELVKKISEEADEVLSANVENVASEIADIQQAVDDLIAIYGLSKEEVLREQKTKKNKNGSFKKGIYIEYLDLDEDNEWVKYYRNNSDRYPEQD